MRRPSPQDYDAPLFAEIHPARQLVSQSSPDSGAPLLNSLILPPRMDLTFRGELLLIPPRLPPTLFLTLRELRYDGGGQGMLP